MYIASSPDSPSCMHKLNSTAKSVCLFCTLVLRSTCNSCRGSLEMRLRKMQTSTCYFILQEAVLLCVLYGCTIMYRYISRCLLLEFHGPPLEIPMTRYAELPALLTGCSSAIGTFISLGASNPEESKKSMVIFYLLCKSKYKVPFCGYFPPMGFCSGLQSRYVQCGMFMANCAYC